MQQKSHSRRSFKRHGMHFRRAPIGAALGAKSAVEARPCLSLRNAVNRFGNCASRLTRQMTAVCQGLSPSRRHTRPADARLFRVLAKETVEADIGAEQAIESYSWHARNAAVSKRHDVVAARRVLEQRSLAKPFACGHTGERRELSFRWQVAHFDETIDDADPARHVFAPATNITAAGHFLTGNFAGDALQLFIRKRFLPAAGRKKIRQWLALHGHVKCCAAI